MTTQELDETLEYIQIQTLFRNSPSVILASVFSALVLTAVYWSQHVHAALLIWLGAILSVNAVRGFFAWEFHWKNVQIENIGLWCRLFFIPSLLSASIWGVGAYIFYIPNGGQYQAIGIVVPLALAAGSLVFLSMVRWLFFSSFLLITLPLLLRVVIEGDFVDIAIGLLVAVYITIFMIFGYGLNRILAESLRLRFENLELVERLTREKESAELANVAKSRFLAAASHDLRQPLHALSLLSSALCDRIKYPEVKHIVDKIMLAVSALENLFNALLDISKLDSGVLKPNLVSFRLRTIFDKIENDYRPEADRKGLEFIVDSCCNSIVYSDDILLERVVRNFVSNALRYTEKGRIRLYCKPANGKIIICVEDSGIGIHGDSLQEIFDEYVQIDNPERDREKGLGLGLAIVARISQLLDYRVYVNSVHGKGSDFSIEVPLGRKQDIPPPETTIVRASAIELRQLKVLIIDDERSNLDALDALLRGWKCEVIPAESGEEACEKIRELNKEPDCILTDYRLRNNKTGLDAIKSIFEVMGRSVPAVLITGDVAINKLHEEGADAYHLMHKPVQPARLRALLKYIHQQKLREKMQVPDESQQEADRS
ncbi:MAG TPA: hybrid sensor histidine kinase/response regulator [Gammaproteobacteria bacterium]|nr:hybrid sensor histidine kinase/response regulator [Gammaproteobacteria bacterium]